MRPIGMRAYLVLRAARAGITTAVAILVLGGCTSARTTGDTASRVPALAAASGVSSSTAASNGPASGGTSGAALVSARAFGTGSADKLLTLTPPGAGDKPVVPQSVARSDVDNPFSAPVLLKPVLFTLARATVSMMLTWEGAAAAPVFRSTLAWVGVFEVDPRAPHGCPPEPAPASFPPLLTHYYFAVLVDATTGAQATWNEDMSGLLMRQCAGLWTSTPNS